MRNLKLSIALMVAGFAASLPANALGLLEGYRQILQNDPTLQAARYEREAGQAEIGLARAGLLPQVSASGSKNRVKGTLEQTGCIHSSNGFTCDQIGNVKQYEAYPSWNTTVALRQPIFNAASWYQYQEGKAKAQYSNNVFDSKLKEAATRYLQAYLNVLLAQENIELSSKQIEALKGQLALAKHAFEAGDGTITDVDDAQARLDLAQAQRIEAQSNLEINLKKLVDLTGSQPKTLRAPNSSTLVLEQPKPATASAWYEMARQNSPQIKAAEDNVTIAKRELQRTKAQHMPTLDFILQSDKSSTVPVGGTAPENLSTRTVGLQINIPIFSGGYISAQSSQALARFEQAQSEFDATTQQINQDIVTQHSGVVSGVSKIQALRAAVASSEKALQSNKKGFLAGARANIDILNAEQQVYQARRDLAQATFTYLLSWVQLKADSGVLSEEDITTMDRAFTVDHPTIIQNL